MDKHDATRFTSSVSDKCPSEDEISMILELFRKQITFPGTSKNKEIRQEDSSEQPIESLPNNFDLGYLINKRVSSFAIPSFSTTSLTIVWIVNLLVCLLCFVLAEIYQGHLDMFPLILLVVLGCHIITLNNFFSYMLGRHRYGAHRYRLYQPFQGGHRFVIMQFFGISCVLFSLAVAFLHTLFLLSSSSHKEAQHGLYTTVIVFGVAGNILLHLSLYYFQPHEGERALMHADGNQESPTSNNGTFFNPTSFLELLYISPNCESALVVIFAIAQCFVSALVVMLPEIATIVSVCFLVLQLLSGATVHFFIGRAYKPGYCLGTLRLRRSADTIGFWIARALYIASVAMNALFLKSSSILHATPFVLVCIATFNGFSNVIFLFIVRSTSFSSIEVKPSNGIFRFFGAVLNVVTYLLGAVYIVLTLYITLHEDEMNCSDAGRSARDILYFCLQLILVFSLFLAPITQVAGCAIHGANFTIHHSSQGRPAFLFIQCGAWLLYLSELLATALFLFTGTHSFGLIASLSSAFSVTCITFSERIYNARPDRLCELEGGVSAANLSDMGEDGSDVQDFHLDNASKQQRPESRSAFDKRRSLLLDGGSYSEDEVSGNLQLGSLLNAEMICAYVCAFASFTLCLVLDLSEHYKWFDADIPRSKLLLLGCLFYGASVPLADFSSRSKGIHVFYLFSSSPTFVVLHALSWTVHVLGIVVNLFIFAHYQEKDHAAALKTHTIRGLLQFIPLILITIYIAMEYKNDLQNRQRRWLGVQALDTLNQILSKMVERSEKKEDKDALQIMFSAVAEPVLQTFGVLDSSEMLYLRLPIQASSSSEQGTPEGHEASHQPRSVSLKGSIAPSSSVSSANHVAFRKEAVNTRAMLNAYERRRLHQDMGIIVMLLFLATASLFMIGSIPSSHDVFRVGCAVFGLIVCTGSCLGIHVGYGALLHRNDPNYAVFMPFRGGAAFASYQCVGWIAYVLVVLLTLVANEVPGALGRGGMTLAAVLSGVAQVSLFKSIPKYTPTATKHFLERNGEAAVAVLVFCFTFALNRLHMFFHSYLVDGSHGPMSYEFPTRFLLYLTTIGVLLAAPLILLAMGRTTQQWRRVRHQMNRQPSREANDPANEQGVDADFDAQDDLKRMWITIVTNTLEIGTIILTMTAPFLTLFFLHYVFSNHTSPLLDAVSYYLPFMLWVAVGTLFISAVPYMADVGIPRMFLGMRPALSTYLVYGLPLFIVVVFLIPAVLAPRLSTAVNLFVVHAFAVGGTYKRVRWAIRVLLYAIIGYLTYKEIVRCLDEFKEPRFDIWCLVMSRFRVYVFDLLIMVLWILYIPSYQGKPYHTGSRRSPRFIKFMKHHVFSEVSKYFSFRLILDSPKVNLRDSSNNYLFSFHPHGVVPGTALFAPFTDMWQEKVGSNSKTCVVAHAASVVFNVPFIRDFNMSLNALSVSRHTIEASLDRGNSAIIVTGGQSEMLRSVSTDKFLELITYHIGFVRLALRKRVPLVPLLSFGENNIMSILQFPWLQQLTLKLLGYPFPMILYGRFLLPLPRRTPLTLVVGSPVDIPVDADPENEEHVKKLAETYFQEVERLFYRHRVEAGYPKMELHLIKRK
ncbi:unnamed protein product [Phytomonas sp. EM1]|nr:unnamed protein product [Phytomonas sp. EM1]|eukprot:CCW60934.1 unnamed protein product [Phytomonas sp. isolate EM1]